MISPVLYDALLRRNHAPAKRIPSRIINQPFSGQAIYIPDGDGFTVSLGTVNVSVRLYGIDAPERGQSYFNQSRHFLAGQIWNKPVTCFPVGADRYGRMICDCYGLGRHSLSLLSVLFGYAWHYKHFAPDDVALRDAQRLARLYRRGLWLTPPIVPPWIFRWLQHRKGSIYGR